MKFLAPELAGQFTVRLHYKVRDLCNELEAESKKRGWHEPVVTAVSRDVDFYLKRGLKPKAFSWHFVDCAVDLRNWHYTPEQLPNVLEWLKSKTDSSEWEVVTEDHGTGPHFHIGYRDFSRRRAWEQKLNGGK